MAKTAKSEKTDKIITGIVSELLSKLEVEAKVETREESSDHFLVNIETKETGLLIGRHGETINGLQLLTGIILFKKLGVWVHVVLDVGGYRKMREESIREMVSRIIQEVESNRQPVVLPYLTPLERRFVHMLLAQNEKVASESIGEGKDRRVTIKPRTS